MVSVTAEKSYVHATVRCVGVTPAKKLAELQAGLVSRHDDYFLQAFFQALHDIHWCQAL